MKGKMKGEMHKMKKMPKMHKMHHKTGMVHSSMHHMRVDELHKMRKKK